MTNLAEGFMLISEQEKSGKVERRKDMQTMTSAYANKMLKSLEEDKAFWLNKEEEACTYVAAINEEPVVPDYDYVEVATTIAALDEKIAIIKHELNVTNANAKVLVGDVTMSIDSILIKMAQLNRRKTVLDVMRKRLPKSREEQRSYMSRNSVPEYRYINYDLELVKNEYELIESVQNNFKSIHDEIETLVSTSEENSAMIENVFASVKSQTNAISGVVEYIKNISSLSDKLEEHFEK